MDSQLYNYLRQTNDTMTSKLHSGLAQSKGKMQIIVILK